MESQRRKPDTDEICLSIVEAIADCDAVDPVELDPVHDRVDLEALASLVAFGSDVRVTFQYEGHVVVVSADGVVTIDGEAYELPLAASGRGRRRNQGAHVAGSVSGIYEED